MVDTAKIFVRAGDGGNGSVHFRREKFIPKGGPDGGDGGRGGSVYIETDKNLATLEEFAYKQKFEAEDGGAGSGKKSSGKAGSDLVIKVPVGTIIRWEESGEERMMDLDSESTRVLIAHGGKGGRGNDRFKNSTNTTPMEAEDGEPGENKWLFLELKLLADVGLVGFPNVGKSTLLSVLSAARPKIADYEFTTLEPNLGVMKLGKKNEKSVIVADIPGLIQGASEGKGLGEQFLRHIERTKVLIHVLAPRRLDELKTEDDLVDRLWDDYQTIRRELEAFGGGVEGKKEIVVLNKTDLLMTEWVDYVVSKLKLKKITILPISCGTTEGVDRLKSVIAGYV